MERYINITTSGSATTLMEKGSNQVPASGLRSLRISNNSANPATIIVDLYDGTTVFYICKNVIIPTGTVLLLQDNVSFDTQLFNLRLYNTGTDPDLTVIMT